MVNTLGSSIKDVSNLFGEGVNYWSKFAHGKTADTYGEGGCSKVSQEKLPTSFMEVLTMMSKLRQANMFGQKLMVIQNRQTETYTVITIQTIWMQTKGHILVMRI